MKNENTDVFETYLPIQLDATCNGFQHLAMLSNETKLFKELNLSKTTTDENPHDFYNYMLLKVTDRIKWMVLNKKNKKNDPLTPDQLESYKRIDDFI